MELKSESDSNSPVISLSLINPTDLTEDAIVLGIETSTDQVFNQHQHQKVVESSTATTEGYEASIVDCSARKRKAFSPSSTSSFVAGASTVEIKQEAPSTDFTVVDSSNAAKIARLVAPNSTQIAAQSNTAAVANQAQILTLNNPAISQQLTAAGLTNNVLLRFPQLAQAGPVGTIVHHQQVLRAPQLIQNPANRVIAAQAQLQQSSPATLVLNQAVANKQLTSPNSNQQQHLQAAGDTIRTSSSSVSVTSSSHTPINSAGKPASMSIQQKDTTYTKIFVGGLPYHTTDSSLREYFANFGEIDEAVVITDRQSGKSRGYGFVTMADKPGADRACKDPNPVIDGRKANVNLAYIGAKPRVVQAAASLYHSTNQIGIRIPQGYVQANPYSSAVSAIYTPYVPPTAAAYVTPNGVIIQQAQANQHPNQHIIDYNGGYLAQLQAPQAQYAADVAAATGNGTDFAHSAAYAGASYTTAHLHHHTANTLGAATSVAGPQLIAAAAPTQAAALSVPTAAYQNLPTAYAPNMAAAYAAGPFAPAPALTPQTHLAAAQTIQHATAGDRF